MIEGKDYHQIDNMFKYYTLIREEHTLGGGDRAIDGKTKVDHKESEELKNVRSRIEELGQQLTAEERKKISDLKETLGEQEF